MVTQVFGNETLYTCIVYQFHFNEECMAAVTRLKFSAKYLENVIPPTVFDCCDSCTKFDFLGDPG